MRVPESTYYRVLETDLMFFDFSTGSGGKHRPDPKWSLCALFARATCSVKAFIRRNASQPMRIAMAIYFVMGLARLGNIHDATLMGLGYLGLAECYRRAYGRRE